MPRQLDQILFGPDGKFLFKNRKLGICALGKEKDYTYDVGALGLSFRFCRKCINKEGAVNLRRDSNHALASAKVKVDAGAANLRKEMREMTKRFKARFGEQAVINWGAPKEGNT